VDRDFSGSLTRGSLGLEGLAGILRREVDAAERRGALVDFTPARAANFALAHSGEEHQCSEDARFGLGLGEADDVLQRVGPAGTAAILSTQQATRQDAWVDDHELLPPRVAACRAEEAVDVGDILLAERATCLRALRGEQLANEPLGVTRPKLLARQIREPRAAA